MIIFPLIINSQEVGSKAPDFSDRDLEGNNVKLSEISDKVIVLDFWASWCIPCKKSMPHLADLYNKLKDVSLTIIGVNLDEDKNKINTFKESIGIEIPFTIINDKESKLPILYNVEGMPTTIIIDKQGIIKFKETGFDNDIKEKLDKTIYELLGK
jgi:thiol-disulfide isomerase/thioredoxin